MTSAMTSSCVQALHKNTHPANATSPGGAEGQELVPFVPFMKQRPTALFHSARGVEDASNTSAESSDRAGSVSPLSTGSDSLVRPLSSSWSSESSSPTLVSAPSNSIKRIEGAESNEVPKRAKKRSLFTIDAILGDEVQAKDKEYSIKRVSQISSERPAKMPRRTATQPAQRGYDFYKTATCLMQPSAASPSPSVATTQQHQAFLQNYIQQMSALAYGSPRPAVVPNNASYAHGLPTPPLTPLANAWFPAPANGFLPVLMPAAAAGVPSVHASTFPRGHNLHHQAQNFSSPFPTSRSPEGQALSSSDGSADGKGKRNRTVFTAEQLQALEDEFAKQHYMVGSERYFLARKLKLNEAQVKVWFQNRRIKWRKQRNQSGSSNESPDAARQQEDRKSNFQLLQEEAATASYR